MIFPIIEKILLRIRASIVLFIKPKESYWLATKSLKPLSNKFGFDRGKPIDRYWIESFLNSNKKYIKGVCLEITDNRYTNLFGGKKVTKSDVLDIDPKNGKANIIGDLRNLKKVKSNTYNCVILTQVLGIIDEYEKAISEIKRVLRPQGRLLLTVSSFSPTRDQDLNYWRFTTASAKYVFSKYFGAKNIQVSAYGNVLTGQCFWVGISQEELSENELKYNDPSYQCLIAVVAQK